MFEKIAFNRKIRAEVWQMIADLTGTGMELGRSLDLVGKSFERRSPSVKRIMMKLRKSLAADRFVETVNAYTPSSEALIFSRFGATNDADVFRAAARIAKVEAEIQKAIISAVVRPMFILTLILVLLFFLGKDFYPTLQLVSPMESWPDSWQVVAKAAIWVAENPFMILIYMMIIFGIYRVTQRYYVGPARTFLDRLPPFSLYRLSNGATFTFVILENAAVGNAINSALLKMLSKNSSLYVRSRILKIGKNLESMNIGTAALQAGQDFPDPELNAVLEAYAEQKDWVPKFRAFAETWLERLEAKVKSAVAVLNTALLIFTAAFIAVVGRTIFGVVNIIQ